MTDIRMIALDLDGTTLTRGHITPRTRRALVILWNSLVFSMIQQMLAI